MSLRLTKRHRLLSSQDFSQVFSNPVYRVSTRNLLVLATDNDQFNPRLGLVISKKNVGCAVARNRIKRLCREAFRLRLAEFPAIDLIILARTGLNELENSSVVAILNGLFDQLRVKSIKERGPEATRLPG